MVEHTNPAVKHTFQALREVPLGSVWENRAWPNTIWSGGPCNHNTDGTDNLGEGESCANVKTREGLEEGSGDV